jgi:hypothetical protein
MPPQQSQGLLDVFDERFGFGAHGYELSVKDAAVFKGAVIGTDGEDVNRAAPARQK